MKKARGEKAEDCLNTVREIIADQEREIPDTVIDRAHRIGKGKNGGPAAIIVKFTTWRHRTLMDRGRTKITEELGYKGTLDITRDNIVMMDAVKQVADEMEAPVSYVFCDINCQPTIKTVDDQYLRFDSVKEATKLLEKLARGDEPE